MAARLALSKKHHRKRKKHTGNPDWGHSGATSTGKSGNKSGVPKPKGTNYRAKHPLSGKPRGNPAYKKGCPSPNPGGLPADGSKRGSLSKYHLSDLVDAVLKIQAEKDETLMDHFVREAFKSNRTLNDLMKKLLPDLKAVEVSTDPKKPFQLIVNLDPNLPTLQPEEPEDEQE